MTMEKNGMDQTAGSRCEDCGAPLTPQDQGGICEECRDEMER